SRSVLDDVPLGGGPAVTGNDISAALFLVFRNGDVEQAVEAIDDALHIAAALRLDHWIADGGGEIPARDDIGTAKKDDHVTVSVPRLMDQLNRLVVEEEVLVFAEERFRRP